MSQPSSPSSYRYQSAAAVKAARPPRSRGFGGCLLLFTLIFAVIFGFLATEVFLACKSVSDLRDEWPDTTSFMRYRMKQAEDSGRTYHLRWHPVPMESIAPSLKSCVLTGEDDRFYLHHGFDFSQIRHAVKEAKRKGHFKRGASTLTQQLAKNLYLNPKHSFVRKIREAFYTVLLEHYLSKDRILEIYLNVVEWGDGVFGAQSASQKWFGHPASALTLDQSARLAAVLPKPLRVHPNGSDRFVLRRRNAILTNLRRYKGIGRAPSRVLIEEDDEDENLLPSPAEAIPEAVGKASHAVDTTSAPSESADDSDAP